MDTIDGIINWVVNIEGEQVVEVLIAILIFMLFRIFSSRLAYMVVKIFKPKSKGKDIKNHGFYQQLKTFFKILGLYLGILLINTKFDFKIVWVNKIFKIAVIILAAKGFADCLTTKSTLVNKVKNRVDLQTDDTMFRFILKAIRIIIYIVAGFLVSIELGYNLNGLVAGLGVGSIVLTLAAQDTAKNLFGGVVIFLDKPFVVGDWIQVEEYEGTVEDITFRSTRIRTFENSVVNVPNAVIANDSIINWSRMEKRRNKVNLCLDLDTPMEKVVKVQGRIKEMLKQHDEVIDDTIIVRFDNITDNGINLMVVSYTNSVSYPSFLEEKEKINFKIMQILKEENVELAYDTKTIYVKN